MNRFTKRIKKYYEFFYTKIKLFFTEKRFYFGDVRLKYLLSVNKKSNNLIVVFSACTRDGVKARYNYVKTLGKIKENKLFILDDFASDKRGCYYLGQYPDYAVEKATDELIKKTIRQTGSDKVIFCGSSKGGWASLNFGFHSFDVDKYIVCGAPQFNLGEYIKYFNATFSYLKNGRADCEVIDELNFHLKNSIVRCDQRPAGLFIHYSDSEHTYSEHIADLLELFKEQKITYVEDKHHYIDHWDVAFYFPTFLVENIKRIIGYEKG